MVATPIDAASLARCQAPPIRLGARFTQVAVKVGQLSVSLDVREIRAGDVFLFAGPPTSLKANPVYRYQRLLVPPDEARWTHCAIVDENLTIWDAMPSADVRSRLLREMLRETQELMLVRPQGRVDPARLAQSLLDFSNHRYRIARIETIDRLGKRVAGIGSDLSRFDDDTVMCSLFVLNVLRRATGSPFLNHLPIAVPADFVRDPDFTAVPIEWCLVER